MAKIAYIKELYESEGLSLNEIARQTGKNFRTVQKYAYQTNWSEEEKPSKTLNFPVMGEYIKVIDSWLEQDEKEPRKQRHTIKRIFERLKSEHGFTGSYQSVRRYVSYKKAKKREEKISRKFSAAFAAVGSRASRFRKIQVL